MGSDRVKSENGPVCIVSVVSALYLYLNLNRKQMPINTRFAYNIRNECIGRQLDTIHSSVLVLLPRTKQSLPCFVFDILFRVPRCWHMT